MRRSKDSIMPFPRRRNRLPVHVDEVPHEIMIAARRGLLPRPRITGIIVSHHDGRSKPVISE